MRLNNVIVLLSFFAVINPSYSQELFSNESPAGRSMVRTNFATLGALCDSLQVALNLTPIDVVPVSTQGTRVNKRFDQNALHRTLDEMYTALGLVYDRPQRFTRSTVEAIFQQVLTAAAESEPSVQTLVVSGLTSAIAILNGEVSDDGRKPLQAWGFKFGTDSTLSDSLYVPFGDYQSFLDTSAKDTGNFDFERTALARFTTYYYAAWAENENGIAHGDTLSFRTLPELATGLTASDTNATSNSVELKLAISDDGGQSPQEVGYWWSDTEFTLESFSGDSTAASSNDAPYTASIDGLTRFTKYYYTAYSENLAGRTMMQPDTFWTLPDLSQVGSISFMPQDSTYSDYLYAKMHDNGGQVPDSVFYRYSFTSDLQDATVYKSWLREDSTFRGFGIVGMDGYAAGFIANNAGIVSTDTISFSQPAMPSHIDGATGVSNSSVTLHANVGYRTEPTEVGFIWSWNQDLSDAQIVPTPLQPDSTFLMELTGLPSDSILYWDVYAKNSAGRMKTADDIGARLTHDACNGIESVNYHGVDYPVVSIGYDCYFDENLRSTTYRNGDPITSVTATAQFLALNEGGVIDFPAADDPYYDGYQGSYGWETLPPWSEANGKLYTLLAFRDPRGLCPAGWAIPSGSEWLATEAWLSLDEVEMGWRGYGMNDLEAGQFNGAGFDDDDEWITAFKPTRSGGYGDRAIYPTRDTQGSDQIVYWLGDNDLSDTDARYAHTVRCILLDGAPIVYSDTATNVTSTSATLTGLASEDGQHALTGVGITWGYQPDLSDGADVSASLGTIPLSISVDLTGLTLASDTVFWSAFAENSEGRSYGDTLKVYLDDPCLGESSVTYNNFDYETIGIGDQCWFAENLRTDEYTNGDALPSNLTDAQWASTTSGASAVNTGYIGDYWSDFGRVYNWAAVNDARGLCPTGWHVPTHDEFDDLISFLGGGSVAGGKMKSSAEDTPSWDGSNSSGFSGLPAGRREGMFGEFVNDGHAYYWTATPHIASDGNFYNYAYYIYLLNGGENMNLSESKDDSGFSIRCLQD